LQPDNNKKSIRELVESLRCCELMRLTSSDSSVTVATVAQHRELKEAIHKLCVMAEDDASKFVLASLCFCFCCRRGGTSNLLLRSLCFFPSPVQISFVLTISFVHAPVRISFFHHGGVHVGMLLT